MTYRVLELADSPSTRMNSRTAVNVLRSAVARRVTLAVCFFHSDRGAILRSWEVLVELTATPWSGPWASRLGWRRFAMESLGEWLAAPGSNVLTTGNAAEFGSARQAPVELEALMAPRGSHTA